MALGWQELLNTKIDAVCYNGPGTCDGVINAWNSGVMDTLRNRMIIWGGGHTDYAGNEIYAVNLSGTPNVERINDPTAGGCSLPSCDGGLTPNARHTYDALAYIEHADRMFIFTGALSVNGNAANDTWTFSFADETWHLMNPSGTIPAVAQTATGYDPNTQKVFLTDQGSLYAYTLETDNYELVGSSSGHVGYWMTGVVDPVRQKFVVLGGGESGIYDISGGGSYNRQALSTTGDSDAVKNKAYPGLVYDPVSDRIVAWIGGNTVYSLNLDTNVWTPITSYTGGPGSQQNNGTYKRWNYSAPLDAFVIVNAIRQNTFLFRLREGGPPDTTPPTTPGSPSADAVGSSQIDLTWTASTDAVGVVGYSVERCTGAACSDFAEIATPATNSYSNTGLTASTLYRYRIRARDAANNYSSYSSTVEDTTPAADPTPPTDPSSLNATTVTYSRIDLTWTASTDAVGVVGYKIERCAGASCSGFVQIGTIPTNSFADLGLAASTLYRYRVRAYDAAGNNSGYSNIDEDTTSSSGVLQVGPGKTYATIALAYADAVNGSTIEIDAGIYAETLTCTKNITLKGVGGYAHLKWDTGDYQTATTDIPNGKGILLLTGDITLENIELSGAQVADGNGSGVRYQGGDQTYTNIYIHDCEEGILGDNNLPSNILTIEYSQFERCGQDNPAQCHNVYIGSMGTLVFRYNRSRYCRGEGHLLKSRALVNYVISNHLTSKEPGVSAEFDASFELEFSSGGIAYVIGNVIEQGANTSNSTMISFGAEGLPGNKELYVVNNTVISHRAPPGVYVQTAATVTLWLINNIFHGAGTVSSGSTPAINSGNIETTNSGLFVDFANSDFRLVPWGSPVDAGVDPGSVNSYSLTPVTQYVAVANQETRTTRGSGIDVGAYEVAGVIGSGFLPWVFRS